MSFSINVDHTHTANSLASTLSNDITDQSIANTASEQINRLNWIQAKHGLPPMKFTVRIEDKPRPEEDPNLIGINRKDEPSVIVIFRKNLASIKNDRLLAETIFHEGLHALSWGFVASLDHIITGEAFRMRLFKADGTAIALSTILIEGGNLVLSDRFLGRKTEVGKIGYPFERQVAQKIVDLVGIDRFERLYFGGGTPEDWTALERAATQVYQEEVKLQSRQLEKELLSTNILQKISSGEATASEAEAYFFKYAGYLELNGTHPVFTLKPPSDNARAAYRLYRIVNDERNDLVVAEKKRRGLNPNVADYVNEQGRPVILDIEKEEYKAAVQNSVSKIKKMKAVEATLPEKFSGPNEQVKTTDLWRMVTDYFTGKPHSEFAMQVFLQAEKLTAFRDGYDGFPGLIEAIERGDKAIINELLKMRVPSATSSETPHR